MFLAALAFQGAPTSHARERLSFRDESVELTAPVVLDGDVVGWIVIHASLAKITSAIATYIGDLPIEQHRVLTTWAEYVFPVDTGCVVLLPTKGAA